MATIVVARLYEKGIVRMATDFHDSQPAAPLVSCLLVTLPVPQRFAFACASIEAFCAQTYQNKEMVLVINGGTEDGRRLLREHVLSLNRPNIRMVEHGGELSLGALRNISVENAAGDIHCQWDDDDLHHPERLQRQVEALLQGGFDALFLQEVMQYFPESDKIYWTNWSATPAGGHPGTLMARATTTIHYPVVGQDAHLGEDLRVALALKAQAKVGYLSAMPHLFVYVSHGKNSWNSDHHRHLIDSLAISAGLLRRREAQIRAGLDPFSFPSERVEVSGNSGPAFIL